MRFQYRFSVPGSPGVRDVGSFDCLRLLAAIAVIFSHCWAIRGRPFDEPLIRILGDETASIGTMAVYAFFAISGFLVTDSWFRDPSPRRFMLRRALRIFPGLAFVIFGSALVIGPLVTLLPLKIYFAAPETYLYLLKTFIFPEQKELPGVFMDVPFAQIVNGSLWTLRLEFVLYIAVLALGLINRFPRKGTGFVLAFISLALADLLTHWSASNASPLLVLGFKTCWYAVPFFVGMAMARITFQTRLMNMIVMVTILVDLSLLILADPLFHVVALFAVPFATLLIATHSTCRMSRFGDYSYGMYLWGFPIEQLVMQENPGATVLGLFVRALPLTLCAAVISWHLVEKNALRFKPRR